MHLNADVHAAGCPLACMPLGLVKYSDENARPFGLCAAAPRGQEALLLSELLVVS
jgi:Asp-tRNA(Asn)/Glu-tRNA(Gln) amidotransferase A subunit family amidase